MIAIQPLIISLDSPSLLIVFRGLLQRNSLGVGGPSSQRMTVPPWQDYDYWRA